MASDDRGDIIRLATADTPLQAHIWQQTLDEEGIKCQVVGDFLDAGLGDIPGMKAELWVQRDDVERALAILRKYEEARAAGNDEEEESDEEDAV
jgi:hypothetical protein